MKHTKLSAMITTMIMAASLPYSTISAQDAVSINANSQGVIITKHSNQKAGSQDTVVNITADGVEEITRTGTIGTAIEGTEIIGTEPTAADSLYDEETLNEKPRIRPMVDFNWMERNIDLVAIMAIIFGSLLLATPFIAAVLIYNSKQKTKRSRNEMITHAIEQGKPIPESILNNEVSQTNAEIWSGGVKQTAIGIGLIIMFCSLGCEQLWGIGALIACMGIGKMVIAKTTHRNDENK